MRALLITHGSRGDVQPFAALAKALNEAGHRVTLVAPAASAGMAEPYCERVVKIHDGPNVLADDKSVVNSLESRFRGLRGKVGLITTARKTRRLVRTYLGDIAAMVHDARARGDAEFDVLVYHVSVPAHHVAELLGIPSVVMCPQPYWVPTDAFPDPSMPYRVPGFLNKPSYVASRAVLWAFAGGSAGWREQGLGLERRRTDRMRQADGTPTTVLHAFSELLLPAGTRYPEWVHTDGFWFLPSSDGWTPPEHLTRFLEAGPAPVYIGFASSVVSDPAGLGRLVRDAVRKAGTRAVVVGGWSGLTADDLGEEIMFVRDVPFSWLFEQVSAVVHHGGLGTTGTALAAGRPQVVCPSFPDQWWSGRSMHRLGVAPAPISDRALSSSTLAAAITRAVSDPGMAARAKELRDPIRAEDGTGAAVNVIEAV
ncbi:glycosyltransferase, partial [Phytoactinopolyspora endophytica]|uniref:glycosyltransferase n=1 Tax=Phytoactinopolyspora endophytica TaxID=1642495 RepID=UPI0013EE3698